MCMDDLIQALLAILDSPLNKAGRVSALYVETESGKLIAVNPHVRLPRTFKRFCGIMGKFFLFLYGIYNCYLQWKIECTSLSFTNAFAVQLLEKMSIHASGKGGKLLKLISNPVTRYLPINSRKIGLHSTKVISA